MGNGANEQRAAVSRSTSGRMWTLATCCGWFSTQPRSGMLFVLLALAFAGCAVGPNYKRPPTPAPATFANAAGVVTTNAQLPTDWWRTFNDPLLERFISQASTNNYDLRRAQARLREARALWTAARFDFAPTVRSSAGYEKVQLSRDAAGTKERRSELYRAGFDAVGTRHLGRCATERRSRPRHR